ncbi:bifunctional non-homologous end joining protein LigD [Desulfotomaculum arcticum]|uniref:DNA ligase (ATP) n=1 Tax=Desulfotruncus arcticus DSM 17038 TaxID=1121424 RepID=A0A1I2SC01_9FIRM|nr:non-homologous end-joining DNA ligase [Desulfotruncus arcticus]SFG50362.1 bifunctional non-homologous end joining protein LigD [Desulfotomaculum arcticum] [Desulfotruncus arcticus DSM 17038]
MQLQLPLLKPMLAVRAKPFDHPDYIFEVKWDGYRCLAYLEKGITRLLSRNQKDLTGAFPDLADMHAMLSDLPLVLDGEIIVMAGGKPSFDALQSRAGLKDRLQISQAVLKLPALFMTFDILYHQGKSLLDLPLHKRREVLETVIKSPGKVVVSETITEDGVDFYHACVQQGLEGIMAKQINGRYLPGNRSPLWKKIRHTLEADLVICGCRAGNGSRILGALVLGAWNGKSFIYQGMVGTGFSKVEERSLLEKMQPLKTDRPWLTGADIPARSVYWTRPELVCQVEYLTLTREGYLRHPVYKWLRTDKDPTDCTPLKNE